VFNSDQWFSQIVSEFHASPEYQAFRLSDRDYQGRLVPLCTPVVTDCDALVIGANHSDFVDGGGEASRSIAEGYANGNPDRRNTLLDDDHKFARNLRSLCRRAGHPVTERWVSTNRSPIQSGPVGVHGFTSQHWYRKLEHFMDLMLLQLIGEIQPKNVLLCGNYAAQLLYGRNAQVSKIEPALIEIEYKSQRTLTTKRFFVNAIPIWHPSRVRYSYSEKLAGAWQD
jgi:hypothetical protein